MAFPTGSTAKKLTIDSSKVSGSSNLTNFPVLVKDSNITSAVYAAMQGDGDDIRFTTDLDGTTEIPFEIVSLNAVAETCEIWVKVPTVFYNTDTDFYMWYGDATLTPYAPNDTYGSQNVWTSYSSVYHCNQASNAQVLDSTANANNSSSNTLDAATGKLGAGFDNDNTEYAVIPDSVSMNWSTITVSTWVYFDSLNNGGLMAKGLDSKNEWGLWSSGSALGFYVDSNGYWSGEADSDSYTVTGHTGEWFLVHGVYDGSYIHLYVNGAEVGTANAYSSGVLNTNGSLYLGTYFDATYNFDGQMDEARVITSALTSDWIATEYNNQNSPSTFLTMSDPLITLDLTESAVLSDTRVMTLSRSFAESAAFSDLLVRDPSKYITNSLVASDTIDLTGVFAKALAESATLNDSINRTTSKSLTESATLNDSISLQSTLYRAFAESVLLNDSLTTSLILTTSLVESAIMNDSLAQQFTFLRELFESITASDTFDQRATAKRFTESTDISDTISKSTTRLLNESATLNDTISKTTSRSLFESMTASDAFSTILVFYKTLTESFVASETMVRLFGKMITESFTANDTISKALTAAKSFTESITASDTYQATTTVFKSLTESVVMTASLIYDRYEGVTARIVGTSKTIGQTAYSEKTLGQTLYTDTNKSDPSENRE